MGAEHSRNIGCCLYSEGNYIVDKVSESVIKIRFVSTIYFKGVVVLSLKIRAVVLRYHASRLPIAPRMRLRCQLDG